MLKQISIGNDRVLICFWGMWALLSCKSAGAVGRHNGINRRTPYEKC